MPKTRETSFPALSVSPWVGISLSVSESDDRFFLFFNFSFSKQETAFHDEKILQHIAKKLQSFR